jgi:hypothetical protein
MSLRRVIILGIAFAISTLPAMAVENAVGRSLPGVWVMPQGAVVPTEPGLTFTLMPMGYMGAIGGGRLAPIAGNLVANVSANISENLLIPQYVYKTETPKVSFSSSFYLPVNWQGVVGSVQVGDLFSRSANFNSRGIADVFFSPLTAGIHFSQDNNLAIDTKIFAPTGGYKPGNLSNLGMNEWTIQPNVSHTYLRRKSGQEIDNYVGFDIYSQDPTTRYTSGTVFHWDGMLFQYLSERAGFGAIVSNLTQITRDTGPLSNVLNGFRGSAWGAGPIVMYVAKLKNPGVIVQLRWINEFEVTNMTKGNMFLLGLTIKL